MPSQTANLKTQAGIFVGLLGLLALTIGANFCHFGSFSLGIAMLISFAKALLIALFFMEVRYSRPIVWVFAAAGLIWLAVMLLLVFSDYATRSWMGPDWTAGVGGSNHVEFGRASPAKR